MNIRPEDVDISDPLTLLPIVPKIYAFAYIRPILLFTAL